jgi:hypothetical protein
MISLSILTRNMAVSSDFMLMLRRIFECGINNFMGMEKTTRERPQFVLIIA